MSAVQFALGIAEGATPGELGDVGLYAVVLFLPGGLLGALAGLRGWTIAAAAPLLTYAVAGLLGPWYSSLHIGFSVLSFTVGTVAAGALIAGGRGLAHLVRRGPRAAPADPPVVPRWAPVAHLGAGTAVLVATVVGLAALLGGIGTLGAVPQDWDAVFHANGIRYIADTGDGGLYGMARTNWFEGDVSIYYPNAYHLVASLVYRLSGATVPTVLNAGSALVVGTLALGLVALVRRFGGRPVLAAASALAAAAMTSLYDLLWHGPVLPFAAGVVLVPVAVVLLRDLLDAATADVRAALRSGAVFAVGLAGLICLHPSMLFSAVVMAVPAVVQRWSAAPRRIGRELLALAVAGVAGAAVSAQELAGALTTGGNYEHLDRPTALTLPEAVGRLLTFSQGIDTGQLRLAALVVLGLIGARGLGSLRWVAGSAALFATLFVLAAAFTDPVARIISSIWWNDSWRLAGLAAVPLALLVGQGVTQVETWAAAALRHLGRPRFAGAVTAAVALGSFLAVTHGLYLGRNAVRLHADSGDGPALSHVEIAGMEAVARIVPPGSRVLNDRGDGSAWMYALTGLRPVAGHYDDQRIGPDATLLAARFNRYADEPAVRAAVGRLDVHYVQLDTGFLRSWASRQPGLTDLEAQPWLRTVYRNPAVVLYEISPPATTLSGRAP